MAEQSEFVPDQPEGVDPNERLAYLLSHTEWSGRDVRRAGREDATRPHGWQLTWEDGGQQHEPDDGS